MSSHHLVKKLLRVSAHDHLKSNNSNEVRRLENERPPKRRRTQESSAATTAAAATATATPQEILASRVRQMLAMDRQVAGTTASKKALKRMHLRQKEVKSTEMEARRTIVTNSRSSASQSARNRPERTIDKKRYKKEKEEEQLRKIAQKLKAFHKRKKKSSA